MLVKDDSQSNLIPSSRHPGRSAPGCHRGGRCRQLNSRGDAHERKVGSDLAPEAGLADYGDLGQDLQGLLETVGTAAQKAGRALIIFVDEMQYVGAENSVMPD